MKGWSYHRRKCLRFSSAVLYFYTNQHNGHGEKSKLKNMVPGSSEIAIC
jgi:hypothetical protein